MTNTSSPRRTVSDIIKNLNALGDPDSIAEFFEVEGITGSKGDGDICPLANYIKRELDGSLKTAELSPHNALVMYVWTTDLETGNPVYFSTPSDRRSIKEQQRDPEEFERKIRESNETPLARFITRFDIGEYPNLEG